MKKRNYLKLLSFNCSVAETLSGHESPVIRFSNSNINQTQLSGTFKTRAIVNVFSQTGCVHIECYEPWNSSISPKAEFYEA